MSDESSRSARPSGQRRNDGAPSWWAALDRVDLPDIEGAPAAHRRWYEGGAPEAPPETSVTTRTTSHVQRNWAVNLLVTLGVAMVLAIAYVVDQTHNVFGVTLLIGIPVVLAVITTVVVARRSR
jgi:hypothetical protein